VDPDRTDDVRCSAGVVDADSASSAEDASFDREKRRYLLEHIPGTDRFLGGGKRVEVVGKTESKAADQATVSSEELD